MNRLNVSTTFGYSLIEILVSFAILGLLIPPLTGLFTQSFSAMKNAGHRTIAANLGREQVEQLKAIGYEKLYASFTEEGIFIILEDPVPEYTMFKRTSIVENYFPESLDYSDLKLLQITVSVSWTLLTSEYNVTFYNLLAER